MALKKNDIVICKATFGGTEVCKISKVRKQKGRKTRYGVSNLNGGYYSVEKAVKATPLYLFNKLLSAVKLINHKTYKANELLEEIKIK